MAATIEDRRLHSSRLVGAPFANPQDAVRWLGAVQSQDFAGAKWAIGQRIRGVTSADIDRLFNEGKILRTHMLRPTWHFVAPADIRWMLKLTGPRVNAANAYYCRKFELDDAVFAKSNAALKEALQGGVQLTRTEISQVFRKIGINASGLRLAYLIMRAELDGIICSGALRGKQFTYALLDDRVPRAKTLEREEALAELAKRYFASHGPAQAQDFAWWSGLAIAEAKAGIEMAKPSLLHETVDSKTYWSATGQATSKFKTPLVHLLPNYDEYLIAYKDYSPMLDAKLLSRAGDAFMAHIIVLNGQVVGGWRRTVKKNEIVITTNLLVRLDKAEQSALQMAAERYSRFMRLPTTLSN
jgi:hypothetical protein